MNDDLPGSLCQGITVFEYEIFKRRGAAKKLRDGETEESVIDEVVDMLKEEHFLDDYRLAVDVYNYYVRKKQYGKNYITIRLKKDIYPYLMPMM